MATEGRCERSDLPRDMCAHCRNKTAPVAKTMRAQYETLCRSCGGKIYPGDIMGHVRDNWVCPSCRREARSA